MSQAPRLTNKVISWRRYDLIRESERHISVGTAFFRRGQVGKGDQARGFVFELKFLFFSKAGWGLV